MMDDYSHSLFQEPLALKLSTTGEGEIRIQRRFSGNCEVMYGMYKKRPSESQGQDLKFNADNYVCSRATASVAHSHLRTSRHVYGSYQHVAAMGNTSF